MDPSSTLEQLVAESGWLRALARSLVKDDATADDLVQDTYLVAARKLPSDGRPIRPWLARVIVNLARMRGRSGTRRRAREEALGELAPAPARPDELAARVETQRRLAGLVLALAPPLRDVVLLHYVDGLSSSEIGQRLGIAGGTVRWRLKQALDELRARLDARQPNRAWVAAVGGLCSDDAVATVALGKLLLAALAVVIAIGAVVLRVALGAIDGEADPAAAGAVDERARDGVGGGAAAPALALAAIQRAPLGDLQIEGRVVDLEDRPVAGALVALGVECKYVADQPAPVRTAADGWFGFAVAPGCRYYLFAAAGAAADEPAAARVRLDVDPQQPIELRLAVEPARTIQVLDATDGAPIAGATLVVDAGRSLPFASVVTDASGTARFALGRARSILVRADGHVPVAIDLGELWLGKPAVDATPFRTLRLARGIPVTGRVVDQRGAVVVGADVAIAKLGQRADGPDSEVVYQIPEVTDATGSFHAYVPSAGEHHVGAQLGNYVAWGSATVDVDDAGSTTVVIVAERPAASELHVTVLDQAGRPAAGAWVASIDRSFRPGFTDATGRYVARDVSGARLVARRGELASTVVTIADDRTAPPGGELVLHLRPAGVVGQVVDGRGLPAADARVHIASTCNAQAHECTIGGITSTVDRDGRFEFDVPGGEYELRVRHADEDDDGDPVIVTSGARDVRLVVPD